MIIASASRLLRGKRNIPSELSAGTTPCTPCSNSQNAWEKRQKARGTEVRGMAYSLKRLKSLQINPAVDTEVMRTVSCGNVSVGVALNVRFTTNGMCAKNNTHVYEARTSNNRVIMACDPYCYLLPQCEALRTCRSGFPNASESTTQI